MKGKERRIAENAPLRELVDALQAYIAARDAVWALGFWDRLFRKERCRQVFSKYDQAADTLRNAIRMMSKSRRSTRSELAKYEPLISMEEFEALMNKPGEQDMPRQTGSEDARGENANKRGSLSSGVHLKRVMVDPEPAPCPFLGKERAIGHGILHNFSGPYGRFS